MIIAEKFEMGGKFTTETDLFRRFSVDFLGG
jgi:hypothetical protein